MPEARGDLLDLFGHIDIYVFDQILKGRITPRMRVLDAGCGSGRNSRYLMSAGAEVFGIDSDPAEVEGIRLLAADLAPALAEDNFRVSRLDDLPYPDHHFDAVICNAVLHFAEDEAEFEGMLGELWRVLATGGTFFARLASSIGFEGRSTHLRDRWYRLPDGTERFLVDEAYLERMRGTLEAQLLDPIKTTNVQNLRAMTTWVLRKSE
jgi:tellurite methyltransferase